ncbi:MAG: ABC transporter permease [Clostridia bacterium]
MKESYGEPKLIMSRRLRRQGVRIGTFFRTKGKQNIIITAALFGLVLIFTLLNQNFISSYNIVSMAQSLAPYAVLSLGVTFVIATGGIDLSIGTVCIASAVIAGKLYMDGMPLWATIPIMILIGTIFGLINGFLVAKLKLPAFIATLGTMMFARGLSAIIVSIPNIFFPSGTLFNSIFSNANGFPSGLVWVFVLMLLCMYLMFKNKIGRYILSIGSNEEATRLSGINTDKYKIIAYTISGIFAGLAAVFWAASFATVASATGNGMELDAIAGVYIGGTSAAGGVASISGSIIGSLMLVIIRNGLNFVLAKFSLNVNSTYVTFVLTGIIVVVAVLMDVIKNKNSTKFKAESEKKKLKKIYKIKYEELQVEKDYLVSNKWINKEEKNIKLGELNERIDKLKETLSSELAKAKK